MDRNEQYYRKTVSSMGFALLIFLGLFELFSLFLQFLLPWIAQLLFPQNAVAYNLTYELLYATGYLICFMVPVAFLKLFIKKSGYSYQPMRAPLRVSPWLPLMVLAGITLIFSAAYLNNLFMNFWVGGSTLPDANEESPLAVYEIVLNFLVICLVPGFCEEFLFRGAILSNLLPFGRGNAILISSLLFGLMHRNGSQLFYAFVAGILLGLIYERTGSIWNCIILHTINNFFSTAEALIPFRILDETLSVAYAYIFNAILFLAGVVSIVILMLRFFSKSEPKLQDGIYGKSLPACDEYAACPVAPKRAFRLFLSPSMLVFVSMCMAQILLLMVIVWMGGSF